MHSHPRSVLLESLVAPDDERGNFLKAELSRSAMLDPGAVRLVDSPEQADVILYCCALRGWARHNLMRSHPWTARYRDKVFAFVPDSRVPYPLLPGVYVAIRQDNYVRWRHRSGFYVLERHAHGQARFLEPEPLEPGPETALYSFVGTSRNHPVREAILGLHDERAILVDTNETIDRIRYGEWSEREAGWQAFGDSIRGSAFVLCPRGVAVSSQRLFEAMIVGRAPVIVSDGWVPPVGPDWSSFSVRVAEKDVAAIPELLRSLEGDAPRLGRAARAAWEEWFAPGRMLRTIVGWCLDIQASRPLPERLLRYADFPRIVGRRELRFVARTAHNAGVARLRGRPVNGGSAGDP